MNPQYTLQHNGIGYNVELSNGMVDMNGRHLYKISIEGLGEYYERAATIELAQMYARVDINNELESTKGGVK